MRMRVRNLPEPDRPHGQAREADTRLVPHDGEVLLTRRVAAFLLAAGVFQWLVWPNFLRVIARDERAFDGGAPTAFFVVHAVLAVASLALGTALLVLGTKAWRRAR